MYEKNSIFGLNLNEFTDEQIVEKLGLSRFDDFQLIETIEKINEEIHLALEYEDQPRLRNAVLKSSPYAFEAYERYYSQTHSLINNLKYWINSNHIIELYQAMKWDGFFERNRAEINKKIEELNHGKFSACSHRE
jgi:hypothetical protein